MLTAALVFAGLAAVIHVYIFVLESLRFDQPSTWSVFGVKGAEEAAVMRPWAYNQGFYNLFLAAGIVVGLVLVGMAEVAGGRAIILFACACMVGAGIVLVATSRRFLTAAALQAGPPLLAIVAALLL